MRRRTAARPGLPHCFQLQLQQRQLPSPASACGWRMEAASRLCWPCGGHVYFFPFGQKGQPGGGRGRGRSGGSGEYATNSYSKHARKFLQFACIGNSLANRNWNHARNGGVGVRVGETRRMGTEAGNRNRTEPNLSVIEWGSKMYNKGWYNNKKFKMCKKHKKKIHLRQICGFHLNPCTLSPLLCVVVVFRHPISDNNVGKNRCTPMSGLWVHPFRPMA